MISVGDAIVVVAIACLYVLGLVVLTLCAEGAQARRESRRRNHAHRK